MNAADERVQGKFSDRDAEASGPLIPDAQDALAIGYDNYVDILIGTTLQELGDRATERIRNE
jgi:hypothetical protein